LETNPLDHITEKPPVTKPDAYLITIPPFEKLAAALAKAQGQFRAPAKNKLVDYMTKTEGRLRYKYADLADVIEAVREPLSKNGLALTHQLEKSDRAYVVITTLMHESGQKISTVYPLPDPSLSRPQAFGAQMTYARRYSVSAILGIASDDDVDGRDEGDGDDKPEQSKKPVATAQTAKPAPAAKVNKSEPASKTQIAQIANLTEARSVSPGVLGLYLKECYPGVSSANMTKAQAEELVQLMESPDTTETTLMAASAQAQRRRDAAQPQK
jgi:hypothetical protein